MFGAHSKAPLIRPLTLSIWLAPRARLHGAHSHAISGGLCSRFSDFAIVPNEQTEYVRDSTKNTPNINKKLQQKENVL